MTMYGMTFEITVDFKFHRRLNINVIYVRCANIGL